MDGNYKEGFFKHPTLGKINVFENQKQKIWVYKCYTKNGRRALSKERRLDQWTWALSEEVEQYES